VKYIELTGVIVLEEKRTISELVERARTAQKQAESFSQRKADELAAAIVYRLSRPDLAKELAEYCVEETDMGKVESKIAKLTKKMPAVFYQVKDQKTVGVIERDAEMGITKIAKPLSLLPTLAVREPLLGLLK
jgi:sulfoacetaldehyde dehydrogenase